MLHQTMAPNPDPGRSSVAAPPPVSRRGGGGLSDTFAKLATENGWGAGDIDDAIRGLQQVKVSTSSSKPAETGPASTTVRPPPPPPTSIRARHPNAPLSRTAADSARRASIKPGATTGVRVVAPEAAAAPACSTATDGWTAAGASKTGASTAPVAHSEGSDEADSTSTKTVERERLTARGMQAIFAAAHALHKSGGPPPSPTVAAAAAPKAASAPTATRRRHTNPGSHSSSSSAQEGHHDIHSSDNGEVRPAAPAVAVGTTTTNAPFLETTRIPPANVAGAAAAEFTRSQSQGNGRDFFAPGILTSPIKLPPVNFPTKAVSLSSNDAGNTSRAAVRSVATDSTAVFSNKYEHERTLFGSEEVSRDDSSPVRGRLFEHLDTGGTPESPAAANAESLNRGVEARTATETALPVSPSQEAKNIGLDRGTSNVSKTSSLGRDRNNSDESLGDGNGTVAMGGVAVTAFQANSDEEDEYPTLPRPLSPRPSPHRRKSRAPVKSESPPGSNNSANSTTTSSTAASQPHLAEAHPLDTAAAPASSTPTAATSTEKKNSVHDEANALVARGHALCTQKRYAAAARLYTRALETAAAAGGAKPAGNAAVLASAEKPKQDTVTAAAAVVEEDPAWRAKVFEHRAAVYLKLGNVHPAADDCRAALKLVPDGLVVRNYLGAALLKVGSLTASNESYEKVKAHAPQLAAKYSTLAMARGATAAAAAHHRTSAKEATKAGEDAAQGVVSVFALKDAMERAYTSQRHGRHDEASAAAAAAIAIAPHDFKMYSVRAFAATQRKDWGSVVLEASTCAKGIAAAQPKLLRELEAKSLGVGGKDDNADGNVIDKIIETSTPSLPSSALRENLDSDTMTALWADLAPALVSHSDADDDKDRGDEGDDDDDDDNDNSNTPAFGIITAGRLIPLKLLQLLLPALRYSERCEEAKTLLKVVAVENRDAAAWCAKELNMIETLRQGKDSADAAFKRGKYHAAVALYTEALEIDALADAVNAVLYCNRAASHMALGKYDAAVADCNQALTSRPSYPKATLRRARAYVQLRCFAEAVNDFDTFQRESILPSSFGSYRSNDSSGLDASARAAVRTEADLARASLQQQQQQQQQQQHHHREQEQDHQRAQSRDAAAPGRACFRARSESTTVLNRTSPSSSGKNSNHNHCSMPSAGSSTRTAPDMPTPPSPQQQQQQQQQHSSASSTAEAKNNKPQMRRASSAGDSSSSAEWARRATAAGASSSSNSSSWSSTPRRASTTPGSSSSQPSYANTNTSQPQSGANTSSSNKEPNRNASTSENGNTSSSGSSKTRSPVQPVPSDASHYAILGIESNASAAEVKKAYLKLALKFHPDKNQSAGAEERFKKVVQAKEVLTDAVARRTYDAELRSKTFMAASEKHRSYSSSSGYSSSSSYGSYGGFGRSGGVPASSRGSYSGFSSSSSSSSSRYSSASYSSGYTAYSGSRFTGYGTARRNW